MTQQDLARRSGLSRRSVARVEQAQEPVRLATLRKIAAALQVSTSDLADPPADLGSRLHELRRRRGWTLLALAGSAGLTEGAVSKLENGRVASPGAATVAALAAALGVPLAALAGTGPPGAAGPRGTAAGEADAARTVPEAEVARMVREAYLAGWRDALAGAPVTLPPGTGVTRVPGRA